MKIKQIIFRYRGEILEVMDKVTAKVGLIDVGHFSVIRTINGIFPMPSKFRGKPLVSYFTVL